MTDHSNADDLANKSERDLAYAWECADRLAETMALISQTTMSTFASPSSMAQTHQAWALAALAEYRKARG